MKSKNRTLNIETIASLSKYFFFMFFFVAITVPANFLFILVLGSFIENGFNATFSQIITVLQVAKESNSANPLIHLWVTVIFFSTLFHLLFKPWTNTRTKERK